MSSKSSTNSSKPNYLRLDWWMKPENQFWHQPTTHFRYNTEMYDKQLREEVKHHRKFIKL